jgi:outer membrane biosynthesis protein TonB
MKVLFVKFFLVLVIPAFSFAFYYLTDPFTHYSRQTIDMLFLVTACVTAIVAHYGSEPLVRRLSKSAAPPKEDKKDDKPKDKKDDKPKDKKDDKPKDKKDDKPKDKKDDKPKDKKDDKPKDKKDDKPKDKKELTEQELKELLAMEEAKTKQNKEKKFDPPSFLKKK